MPRFHCPHCGTEPEECPGSGLWARYNGNNDVLYSDTLEPLLDGAPT